MPDAALNRARQLYRRGELGAAAEALGASYGTLLARLLERLVNFGTGEIPSPGDEFPAWLAGLFLKRDFQVLAGDACREYMVQKLPDRRIPAGPKWFFEFKNADALAAMTQPPHLALHMADTGLMLEAGQPRVLNPLTGKLSSTALSILPELILLRDTAENVFVSCAPRPFSSNTLECSFILPERKLVLHLAGGNDKGVVKLIREDLARAANNFRDIAGYARGHTHSQGITVADRPVRHLGHYLWNCLSAWETLLQSGLAPRAEQLASWTEGEYFGNPFELLPELAAEANRTLRIGSLEDAVKLIQSSNSLWIPMYDRYIRRELAERIIHHSEKVTPGAFLNRLARLRHGGGPLVLLTIRTGNRAWAGQEEGFLQIMRGLVQHHPGAAFVLDGMNASHSDSSTHKYMDTDAELQIAERIIAAAGAGIDILNTIGSPIAHSIVACQHVDAFVAPWGTAMAKYKWVTNKPGIAFGGLASGPSGIGVRVFDRFRDDMVPAVDISAEYIHDAGRGNLDEPLRRNFDMPWQVVLEELLALLSRLGFKSGQRP